MGPSAALALLGALYLRIHLYFELRDPCIHLAAADLPLVELLLQGDDALVVPLLGVTHLLLRLLLPGLRSVGPFTLILLIAIAPAPLLVIPLTAVILPPPLVIVPFAIFKFPPPLLLVALFLLVTLVRIPPFRLGLIPPVLAGVSAIPLGGARRCARTQNDDDAQHGAESLEAVH